MTPTLTVCIGYDRREPLTWMVLAHSILQRASRPVTILPIALMNLSWVYTRTDPAGTTEFSLSRFLAPYLCRYDGWALFMDSDMVVRTDIYDVFRDLSGDRLVYCCQHDYVPKDIPKATGVQTVYPRKNWSSVMLFNAAAMETVLTPAYVNTASPAALHRFAWVRDEQIGSLPLGWNWLVGEYADNPDAKVLHYTLGAPCFTGYEDSPMADLWWAEYRDMMKPMKTYVMPQAETYAKAVGSRR